MNGLLTKTRFWLMLLTTMVVSNAGAIDFYVAGDGVDKKRNGSKAAPFKSLGYALKQAKPGATIYIRQGVYREQSIVNNVHGSINKPITVTAYPGESVTFNGTLPLSALVSQKQWQHHQGNIFKIQLKQPVWQAFTRGRQLVAARWPNASFSDGSIYSRQVWAAGSKAKVTTDTMVSVSQPHDLAASGLDASGGLIIANTGSFETWTRRINQHQPGSAVIKHNPVPKVRGSHHYYYLEGKLDFLDRDDEWFFEPNSQTLYLQARDGSMPTNLLFKVQSYAIKGSNWSNVIIKGIDFFVTSYACDNCSNITLEDLNFYHASASKRMLGKIETANITRLSTKHKGNSGFIVRNCAFLDTDSQALLIKGNTALIENNDFINIDYAVTDSVSAGESVYLRGKNSIFRRNTIFNAGGSSALSTTGALLTEYNDFSKTGFAQNDGALIHLRIPAQAQSITRYNWCHDTPKYGIRFDAPIPPVRWGSNGLIHHNVVWNANGIMVKGENHQIYHNLTFANQANDLRILDDSDVDGGANKGSITANNISDSISGHRKKIINIPGKVFNNFDARKQKQNLLAQLRDPINLDFRPKPGSSLINAGVKISALDNSQTKPDLGPYQASSPHYWIPGRKHRLASRPIPANGAHQVRSDTDLIWLEAYQATEHQVFIGKDKQQLTSTDKASFTSGNIYHPGPLAPGRYYWRVDAVINNQRLSGEVWEFTVD